MPKQTVTATMSTTTQGPKPFWRSLAALRLLLEVSLLATILAFVLDSHPPAESKPPLSPNTWRDTLNRTELSASFLGDVRPTLESQTELAELAELDVVTMPGTIMNTHPQNTIVNTPEQSTPPASHFFSTEVNRMGDTQPTLEAQWELFAIVDKPATIVTKNWQVVAHLPADLRSTLEFQESLFGP